MAQPPLRVVLEQLQQGALTLDAAQDAIERAHHAAAFEDLGFARLDLHRDLRCGFPEVIFGQNKTSEQIAAIAERLAAHSERVLVTRASEQAFHAVRARLPEATYNEAARAIIFDRSRKAPGKPGIAVLSGGTADIPVAEEAAITAELMGNCVE